MSRNINPEIKLINLDHKTRTIEFELLNARTAFANALRRIMIAEIPTFAFEHVEFQQNTSPLPDEFIAHRLGLIPLISEKVDHFKFQSECDCSGGCPKCQIIYFIDVHCETDTPRLVTTDDLQFFGDFDDPDAYRNYIDAAESVRPVQLPAIPGRETVPITICKLGKGQVLQVLCKAVKGIAREHSKWSPCSCSAYRMDPVIHVNQQFFAEKMKDSGDYVDVFASKCPNNVFKRGNSEEEPVAVINPSNCTFCRQCQEYLENEGIPDPEGKVVIDQVPDKYIFKVESTGALPPETIVIRGFDILKQKLMNLKEHIQQSNEPDLLH
ncbi:DNA-directed RNA polymerase II subunit rpb3 [Tritrichomonas foetus]|uniref:DNA-directed RNA polymerase II subunit rpb3 n=1 Tax=Tritrichomonas foetus TaxID=1144522 RepID=A0A1J4JPJ4_9EUKA|nr:DNA-directed RNA polymerase II subunit rpb3 [Tritrichomonas foetus]|eukprot:OHT00947.1 DNA-directed RNA polymerase II subunit rpb3 [Tritrichomonas foetus]